MSKKNLSDAVQGKNIPPGLKRGQDVQLSETPPAQEQPSATAQVIPVEAVQAGKSAELPVIEDVNVQSMETTTTQDSNVAKEQLMESTVVQESKDATIQEPQMAMAQVPQLGNEQLQLLAEMITSKLAMAQETKTTRRQRVDLTELLMQSIASSETSETWKVKLRKVATTQTGKINQGVYVPESLFTLYRLVAHELEMNGVRTNMGELMAQALIAYIPQLLKDMEQVLKDME